MERKIGEIFEYNGEWYQCVEGDICGECSLFTTECGSGAKSGLADKVFGECGRIRRSDNKHVIFKKLEKVGEPTRIAGGDVQLLRTIIKSCNGCIFYKDPHCLNPTNGRMDCGNMEDGIYIEIKQTKEDMEEKKLIELLSEKVHNAWMKEKEAQGFSYGKDYDKEKKKHPDMLPYNELKEEVKEYDRATVRAVLQAQKELQSKYNYNNLKPFDLEAAKAGKPVCTRDGHKARIICFDSKNDPQRPIVALVEHNDNELLYEYTIEGKDRFSHISTTGTSDLMMLPEKKEGWVNVYRDCDGVNITKDDNIYSSKDAAISSAQIIDRDNYAATTIIKWEE